MNGPYKSWSLDSLLSLEFAQILFAVIFTFARMGCGPYLMYVTLAANNPFLIKVCYHALYSDEYKYNLYVNLFCLVVTSSNNSCVFIMLFRQWHWACNWLVPSGFTRSQRWWNTNWQRGLVKKSRKTYLNPKIEMGYGRILWSSRSPSSCLWSNTSTNYIAQINYVDNKQQLRIHLSHKEIRLKSWNPIYAS